MEQYATFGATSFSANTRERDSSFSDDKPALIQKRVTDLSKEELQNYIENVEFVKKEMTNLRKKEEFIEKQWRDGKDINEKNRAFLVDNPKIVKFVRDDEYELLENGMKGVGSKSYEDIRDFILNWDKETLSKIDQKLFTNALSVLEGQQIRKGDFSMITNFSEFVYPPKAELRNSYKDWLRPVIIDGCALQFAAKITYNLLSEFHHSEFFPYSPNMTIFIRPIIQVLLTFILRGHKTQVYLPRYYKRYLTADGVSKIDDITAFKCLIRHELIVFFESESEGWFQNLKNQANRSQAVLVSNFIHKKTTVDPELFQRLSAERIISISLFPEENGHFTLVLEPTSTASTDGMTVEATGKEILNYPDIDWEVSRLVKIQEQLTIEQQVEQICLLAHLCPLKKKLTQSIKGLLVCVLLSRLDLQLPGFQDQRDPETFLLINEHVDDNDEDLQEREEVSSDEEY